MSPYIVEIKQLRKAFGRTTALDGVNLQIPRGGFYGLIGPDGAGKSTLFKIIAGVLRFRQGSVKVFGQSIYANADAEAAKPHIGFMPQGLGLNLYPTLSVDENIEFFAHLRGVKPAQLRVRKKRLLELTRLAPFSTRAMGKLSGGMKQKLGLVCTLIHEPELIILDEPTTGVDPVSRRDFWAILAELLKSRGLTALVATAYMDEASRFHAMTLMHEGTALVSGTLQTILERAQVDADTATPGQPILERAFNRLTTEPQVEPLSTAQPAAPALDTQKSPAVNAIPTSPQWAICTQDLTRKFGSFTAVDGINLRVRKGCIFGLLGANGAGKTTAIKMLTGLLRASSGRASVADLPIASGREIRQKIGYVSQAFSLYRDLTVLENIQLYGGIYALSGKALSLRTQWILSIAQLGGREHTLCEALPMGLRQRLALGCALIHRPPVLFLDEPTSGVDPAGRAQFWRILRELVVDGNVTILVTTHYMSEAEFCDQVALMHGGKIIADASPQQLKAALTEEAGELMSFTTSDAVSALSKLQQNGFADCGLFGNELHVFGGSSSVSSGSAQQRLKKEIATALGETDITITRSRSMEPSMEDVFVYRVLQQERTHAA